MMIVDDFSGKKVYHYLMESSSKVVLFVLPDINSLKNFDPILRFLKNRFTNVKIDSGLIETLKNREQHRDYKFISMLNRPLLKGYDLIIKIPEIFDYSYFIPEIIGLEFIPDIKMDDQFNFILNYYNIDKFIILNVDRRMDIKSSAEYIDFIHSNGTSVIMIGDPINCAEIVNLTKTNPIVIYKKNIPLITDLIKKGTFVVGNMSPDIYNVVYQFIDLQEELKLFESLK